ncbi:MAG TPA: ABC transporter permease [Chloroflexia bacterium]|nr:ABC transporter permease [Chloroflexia bacterium]
MNRLSKRLIRSWAFVSKEINEVRRQPRLVLSLILGPFLILFLFGIGYQGNQDRLTAIFVPPKTGAYSQNREDYQKLVEGQLDVVRVTQDQDAALRALNRQEVDLVVLVPEDIQQQISAGTQARVIVYFNEVDPIRKSAITYFTYLFISEVNKQTVAAAASQGQESASDVRSAIVRMRNALRAIELHVNRDEMGEANSQVRVLQNSAGNTLLDVVLMRQLLASDTVLVKPAEPQDPQQVNLEEGQDVSSRLSANMLALGEELRKPQPDKARVSELVGQTRADLDTLDRLTQQFQSINPLVLAAPFYGDARNRAPIRESFTSYYAPGVLVLLLQHIAVTLGALSMVREKLLGTIELFRVSPVSPTEILAGKYVGFIFLLSIVAAVLLAMMSNELVVEGFKLSLGVPILGDWATLVLTLALVVFASLGLGFFISAISKSESQAVQLTMLVLLTSVFFSGFFLNIENLWPPIRAVSYALPVTYGISSLQVIMLRGGIPAPALLLALLMLGTFFGLLSFILFNRAFRRG